MLFNSHIFVNSHNFCYGFKFFLNYMGGQGALAMTVELRRLLSGVRSLLPPYESPRLNSDCKASKQKLFSFGTSP